jgi:hypothetical protein
MAWVRVPRENHPLFAAALPDDPRIETVKMFGGVAAKVHGRIFAGLFGRSTMVLLDDGDRAKALALQGASLFDPMGDGRARSDKVMLPEEVMSDPAGLRAWVRKAFDAAAALPAKAKRAGGRKRVPKAATPAPKTRSSSEVGAASPPRNLTPG